MLGFSIRASVRFQILKYLSPRPNWEVAKEVSVLLNAKNKILYLNKYFMYPGTLLYLFL